MRYNNYHKHDHYSNIRTPDVIVKPEDYINRTLELGHTTYFTTNHGCSGNIFEAYDLCKKNNLKCIYGMEMYYVPDRFEKNRSNYHIVVIGLTKNAYYEINRISSLANTEGFYYQPRIDLELLLTLPPNEIIVTTACIKNYINETGNEDLLVVLKNYFGNNFYLEVQTHNHPIQIEWNKKALELSKKYDIEIIHANDSHYIYPEQANDREDLLKGKNINYGDEDAFILDYPNSDIIVERYKKQGVLNEEQAKKALNNTLVFDKAEDLEFNNEYKIPNIYPNEDTNKKFVELINQKWKMETSNVNHNKITEYEKGIGFETNIVLETNMQNYFLINEKIIDLAVNKYGGILSRSGRGSSVSFVLNKLLGFTEIDRFEAEVPLFPTRFMSKSRILETHSCPDIDFNTANPEPFIKAGKEVLGKDGIYYMVAYGTMKESAAFRNLCRAKGLDINDYNDVAKNLEEYKNDQKWKDLIEESKKFIGVIDNISPSPCSFLLLDKPISKEIGLIKVGDEICCCIDGYTADINGYLKNDFLTAAVWKIISNTFKLINKPIPSVKELKTLLDDKVWNLYERGYTASLNQVNSDWATKLVMQYKPKSVEELTAFVAAIRPGFASLLDNFIQRKPYSTGVLELDELLRSSFHYMLYQENTMEYLTWLGIEEDETYGIIKKIAKKKFEEKELEKLKKTLRANWIKKFETDKDFEKTWQVVEDSARYSFNSAHALCVAWDSLYGAYLKANFPLEYFTIILNHYVDNIEETNKIVSELPYFNIKLNDIKFRYSRANYTMDKKTNSIYKGLAAIKYLNEKVAEEIYGLRNNQYNTFTDLLVDIKEKTSANIRQLDILTKLNYFSEFGGNKKLVSILEKFNKRYKTTHKEKTKMNRITEIKDYELFLEDESFSMIEQFKLEQEYLGYIKTYTGKEKDKKQVYVLKINKKNSIRVELYNISTGRTGVMKVQIRNFNKKPFNEGDVIYIKKHERKPKYIFKGYGIDGKPIFEPSNREVEFWISEYALESL